MTDMRELRGFRMIAVPDRPLINDRLIVTDTFQSIRWHWLNHSAVEFNDVVEEKTIYFVHVLLDWWLSMGEVYSNVMLCFTFSRRFVLEFTGWMEHSVSFIVLSFNAFAFEWKRESHGSYFKWTRQANIWTFARSSLVNNSTASIQSSGEGWENSISTTK